jgi:hypothetical protein
MTPDTPPPAEASPPAFTPLPPDTPILAAIADVQAQCLAKWGKPASFIAVPRQLALAVAGDRAAQSQKNIHESHMECLLDGRLKAVLLVLPGAEGGPAVPVIALEMPAPMVAGWTHVLPRYVEAQGLEEHPDYAAVPFSRQLWDSGQGEDIPALCAKLLAYCVDLINRKPAAAYQMVIHQAANARPLVMPKAAEVEDLPADPAIAWAAIESGLDERAEAIKAALAKTGVFGMEFNGDLEDDIKAKLKAAFAERFGCLADYGPHPLKSGWYCLIATPFSVVTGE